ncbi:hypothetical protein EJ05DRAFT_541279 [Pseudovirgaria hyperparasitica]|uniref:Uncharacterized protein n=1 Tax=Pseudovirgaria hyperparasitica TaxID=470096 RepID=A0A6A6VWI9_9PEZI|nr:uncharacterized protein EJ05DRAFT_541279 [Pseudovirgaria hyperparasitica]KAF2754156.1 hypothetical protein EJ05DRAFT_541279 [Pseudovirgaria hyperparasitica]
MSPNNAPPPRHNDQTQQEPVRPTVQAVRSLRASLPPGARHRSEDSWIEVSSQPSSSSLSSVAPDDIITEGLRVQHDNNIRRRRRLRTTGSLQLGDRMYNNSTGASSQEEYEESESESDRIMMSSNEGIRASLLRNELHHIEQHDASTASSEDLSAAEYDDDENSTAVNYPRGSTLSFRPQPNAFTHPPTVQRPRAMRSGSYTSGRPHIRSTTQRHSYAGQRHSPYNVISPSHQADHDAVLRASLSTLLSLGAAARGLPKSTPQTNNTASAAPSSRIEPTSIRMVPESVALGGNMTPSERNSTDSSQPGNPSSGNSPIVFDGKRKSSPAPRSSSKERRTAKKVKRTSSMEDISPTLLTWVMSAGVMVLFSAISFSAGYMVGKEAGRTEAFGTAAGDLRPCGREASSGFRRLKWSGVANAATGVRV